MKFATLEPVVLDVDVPEAISRDVP